MTIRLQTIGVVLGLILAALFAVYVWPTAWMYPRGSMVSGTQILPIAMRINRFSGRAQFLSANGWLNPIVTPAPSAAAPKEAK